MSTFLTVYFWAMVGISVFAFVGNFFLEPEVTSEQHTPLELIIVALIAVPMIYLISVGLGALGLPGALAWLHFAAALIAGARQASAPQRIKHGPSGVNVIGLLLAWHGLQVLRGLA